MTNRITIDLDLTGEQKVTRGVTKTGDALEDFGDDLNKAGKEATFLDKRLEELQGGLKDLFAEFSRSGDLDLLKKIKVDQRELNQLARLQKQFGELSDAVGGDKGRKAGQSLASNVIESFSNAMSRGGTTFVGAVVGAVAAAAPFIGATLAAAVVGTSGLAGIAGGVAMAAQDPRVKDAAMQLGATFMHEFGQATEPFTGPTIAALQQLENATISIAGKLAPEFEGLAAHVEPLAEALGGLVEETLPGFKKALQSAQPVLSALEKALPELGKDFSAMFEDMAANPEATAAALHDLLSIIGETARGIGMLTRFLSSYYEVLIRTGEVTTGWANDLPDWIKAITPLAAVADFFDQSAGAMDAAAQKAPQLGDGLDDVGESAEEAAAELRGLNDAIADFIGEQLGVDQATIRWQQGLRDLNEELREGKRTLSIYSEEGLENRDAMVDMIAQAENFRQKIFEQTGSLDAANEAYRNNIQTLYNMGKAAGFSRDELDKLFAPYLDGPRLAVTEFQFPGLAEGLAKARELARLLGSNAAASAAGGNYLNDYTSGTYVSGRAAGGPVHAGQTYVVGENGPEVLQMGSTNGQVYNAAQTAAWMSGNGSTAMMAPSVTLNVTAQPTGMQLIDVLMEALAYQLRVTGGVVGEFQIPRLN